MFVVLFEVQPRKDRWDDYLGLARQLRPKLEMIAGFIDNERFASKRTEGRLLSLSTWRDEKSVIRWRTHGEHHVVQEKGRFDVFEDYHLRVGEVTSDSAPPAGLAMRETRFDATEVGSAKVCTITEISAAGEPGFEPSELIERVGLHGPTSGLLDHENYESITTPGKMVILSSWRDDAAASQWRPTSFDGAISLRHRHVRVIRDYGKYDRREAPQFYPDVERN